MKVLQRRLLRLSEGVCPACDIPLVREETEGTCPCCEWTYRLRDGRIEARAEWADWLADTEGPQSCLGSGSGIRDGIPFAFEKVHTWHLPTDQRSHE